MEDTRDEYNTFAGVVKSGKGIITQLARRDLTDKLLVLLGVLFFMLTVLYILRKRLGPWVPGALWSSSSSSSSVSGNDHADL